MTAFVDAEKLVREWLLATNSVASLVPKASGGAHIYQAPPRTALDKLIVAHRIGGGPEIGSTVPADVVRMSFDCWASNRADAVDIGKALLAAVEDLGPTGGFVNDTGRLESGENTAWLWLPDPESDKPRYVVDALLIAMAN